MRVRDFIPPFQTSEDNKALTTKLVDQFREMVGKLNGLASGSGNAIDNAMAAAPTTGTWAAGDFVHNSSKSELGAPGSKYVIQGWDCSVSGTPGTWLSRRTLTGN
jgi:hypothetical protein